MVRAWGRKMKKQVVLPFAVLSLAGCVALGPDYETPKLNMAPSYVGGASSTLVQASQTAWWRFLADQTLNDFVSIGLDDNLDIQTALERIIAAEENTRRFGVSQQINGDVSLDARRREVGGTIEDNNNATADAFFVFDIFGEFRRGRERSLAELEAAQFDAATVKLAYLADIVTSYVLVRYYETVAGITRQSIASRRRTLDIVNQRADAQEGTQLEVAQAQSLLRSAEASLPILNAQSRVNAFRIATLLNLPADTVLAKLNASRGLPRPSGGMAIGVPADLLRNRPDIQSAERQLAAATAGIGVTEAQLYPSLRLAGTVTAGDNEGWSFGPSITIPLLDRTRRSATRNIAMSEARQAELAYRLQVNRAVEEVQAALVLVQARRAQTNAYQGAVSTSQRVKNLTRASYEEGLITLDEVLDAEREELSNQLDLAFAISEWAQSWVRLQVALGKGSAAAASTTLAASLK